MSYPKFIDFGKGINKNVSIPTNDSNPLTYCMFPTLNAQFVHGSTSAGMLYAPYSPACQAFMKDYCSNNYDGFCEAYNILNVDRYWPNSVGRDIQAQSYANSFQGFFPTVGENMIRNVVHNHFIFFPNTVKTIEQFDKNVANSPLVSYENNYVNESSFVINLSDPEQIQRDPKVNLMMQNTRACFDVLARIYLAILRNEPNINIKGTVIEKFFVANSEIFFKFLNSATSVLTSFKQNIQDPKCPCSSITLGS